MAPRGRLAIGLTRVAPLVLVRWFWVHLLVVTRKHALPVSLVIETRRSVINTRRSVKNTLFSILHGRVALNYSCMGSGMIALCALLRPREHRGYLPFCCCRSVADARFHSWSVETARVTTHVCGVPCIAFRISRDTGAAPYDVHQPPYNVTRRSGGRADRRGEHANAVTSRRRGCSIGR